MRLYPSTALAFCGNERRLNIGKISAHRLGGEDADRSKLPLTIKAGRQTIPYLRSGPRAITDRHDPRASRHGNQPVSPLFNRLFGKTIDNIRNDPAVCAASLTSTRAPSEVIKSEHSISRRFLSRSRRALDRCTPDSPQRGRRASG